MTSVSSSGVPLFPVSWRWRSWLPGCASRNGRRRYDRHRYRSVLPTSGVWARPTWGLVAVVAILTLARFSEAFLVLRAKDVGLALGLMPLVLVVMNVVYAISAYPMGVLSDRFGRRGLIGLGGGKGARHLAGQCFWRFPSGGRPVYAAGQPDRRLAVGHFWACGHLRRGRRFYRAWPVGPIPDGGRTVADGALIGAGGRLPPLTVPG